MTAMGNGNGINWKFGEGFLSKAKEDPAKIEKYIFDS